MQVEEGIAQQARQNALSQTHDSLRNRFLTRASFFVQDRNLTGNASFFLGAVLGLVGTFVGLPALAVVPVVLGVGFGLPPLARAAVGAGWAVQNWRVKTYFQRPWNQKKFERLVGAETARLQEQKLAEKGALSQAFSEGRKTEAAPAAAPVPAPKSRL
jgi:hypothetical protein